MAENVHALITLQSLDNVIESYFLILNLLYGEK
jgi:hypothetical protein